MIKILIGRLSGKLKAFEHHINASITIEFLVNSTEETTAVASFGERMIYKNSTHLLALVDREVPFILPSMKLLDISESTEVIYNLTNSLGDVSKGTIIVVTLSMFGSICCCLNLGVAFIKLFQVIEILGKLYFIPVKYGIFLQSILYDIKELGNVININEEFLTGIPFYDHLRVWGKLTINQERKSIFNSQPLLVCLYIVCY